MESSYSVDIETIVKETGLIPLYKSDDYADVRISCAEVNRPGLQLAGFYDYFDSRRIQILGKLEVTYLMQFSPEERRGRIDQLMGSGIRMLVVSHLGSYENVPAEFLESAREHNVNLFYVDTPNTSVFMASLTIILNRCLAPRTLMHGVLMEIHGEGVLIIGESGVGKSETAMALVNRGHHLVADDAVEIKRIGRHTLVGEAPEMIRYFLEVRGIGVVDARHLFGVGAVKPKTNVDLVVKFELWDSNKVYDRLGIEQQHMEILGVKVPLNVVPVRPGRNLASILELAAMSNREKKMGYNAAEVLVSRYNQIIDEG